MTSSRIPLSKSGGSALLPLRNSPSEERKRRSGRESRGTELLGLADFGNGNGTSVRVPCSKGMGAPSFPPELSVGGAKEKQWTGEKDQKNRGALRSLPGISGTSVRVLTFDAGTVHHPSPECSDGGVKETRWKRELDRDLLVLTEIQERAGGFGLCSSFERGRSVAPAGMIRRGRQNRRGGQKGKGGLARLLSSSGNVGKN